MKKAMVTEGVGGRVTRKCEANRVAAGSGGAGVNRQNYKA